MSAVMEKQGYKQPRYDRLGNLALAMPVPATEETENELEKALRLSGILQTTLEVNKLIEIFAHEAIRLIDYQCVIYKHPDLGIEQVIGKPSTHECNYRLVVAGETLGELVFSRRKKFTKAETTLMETLLCGLVYPLRNALLYQKAVVAAHKDPLTGVNNRASMDEVIDREVNLATRHKTKLSLLAMDIDHFKKINDTYGHATGDCVIKAVAETAKAASRSSDIIFRYGGEEFLILLSNTGHDGATLLAERMRQKIEETCIICDSTQVSATVSIGITCLHETGDSRESLFSRADAALYQAKKAGRNRCKFLGAVEG
jgi:diguanylate cyclase (GGDEF)-like protein